MLIWWKIPALIWSKISALTSRKSPQRNSYPEAEDDDGNTEASGPLWQKWGRYFR